MAELTQVEPGVDLPIDMQEMLTLELTEGESEQIRQRTGKQLSWLTVSNVQGMPEQVVDDRFAGGPHAVATVVSRLDQRMQASFLQRVEEAGARLCEQIRRCLFPFNDLVHLKRLDLESILRVIDNATLARAVILAPADVRDRVFSCIPSAKRARVEEELDLLGPVPEDDGREDTHEKLCRIREYSGEAQSAVVSAILDAGPGVLRGAGAIPPTDS